MEIISLLGGFLVLLASLSLLGVGAKLVVEKAVRLSDFFGISKFAIGFVFIAVMTSLPELSLAITSAVANQGDLSLGDVLGSNVTNFSLILGLCVLLGFRTFKEKIPIAVCFLPLISLLLLFDGELTYIDGAILLGLFGIFVYLVFKEGFVVGVKRVRIPKAEAVKDFVTFVISIGIVLISASFVVESATSIAKELGIFVGFIGATAVALSTSLPELAVDIVAVRKGRGSLALGDLIGSCATNLTLILGTNVVINPFSPNLVIMGPVSAFVVLTALITAYCVHKKEFTQNDGLIMLGVYAAYLLFIFGIQLAVI